MASSPPAGFRVGPWWVDPHELTLRRGSQDARLQARTMALLQTLHAAAGRVVSKDELAQAVWGPEGATDDLIARHVSMIRQALGDDARAPKYLETVPRRGYRLNPTKGASSRLPLVAAALVLVTLAGLAWLWRSPPADPQRQLASARPLLERGPSRADLAASPDGAQLAYVTGRGVDLAGALMLQSDAGPPRQLVGGLNRFPAFHPDRPELAFFRHRGGCELHVIDHVTSESLHQSRCGGPVSSPALWVEPDRLWYALDPSGGQPSQLLSIEVGATEPEVLWRAPAGQQIQFPAAAGRERFALLWREGEHDLVRLSAAGVPGTALVEGGRIRWLTGHPSDNRLLLARYNDIDRFALYEIGLRQKTLQLISNQHAVLSAAYLPLGVAYSSVDVRRQAVLFQQKRQGYSQSLLPDEDSIRFLALAPRSGTLVYVADTGRQQELRRRHPAGEITVFAAPPGMRLGRPAWSADETQIALPVAGPAEIRVFDAVSEEMIRRIPLAQEASSVYLDEDRLWLLQRRPQGLTLSVLEDDSTDPEMVAEVTGLQAQLSDARDQLFVVDDQFRLLAYPLAVMAGDPEVLASVGSAGGWQVRDGLLYHACPAQPKQKATLCVLNFASGVRLAQPEITYYPSELSVSMGGGALAAFSLESLRIDLLRAEWAQAESL